METIGKPTLRATDRLGQTVSALARILDQTMNEVQMLNAEFQERILQAAQETEASVQQQAAERLKAAVEEAEQNIRALVTAELQARFNEQTAAAVEAARQEMLTGQAQIIQEQDRLRSVVAEWERERAELLADRERLNQLLDQSKDEHSRALAETDEAAAIALERQIVSAVDRVRKELTARWDADRVQLVAERDRALQSLADRTTENQQMLTEVERVANDTAQGKMAAALEQWKTERAQLLAENQHINQLLSEATSQRRDEKSSSSAEALQGEVARVESLIKGISEVIEDANTELSVVIRKNAERAELESYLRGVRFNIQGR